MDDSQPVTVGDVLRTAEVLWQTTNRHPRVRIGEREPIASHLRSAVMFRDRFLCERCPDKKPSGPLHLDHINPWSAGGADTSDNLRLLCERHNLERSNFIDAERSRRPVTWWCINCYDDGNVWWYANGMPVCPIHKPWDCRVMRGYESWLKLHSELPRWHERGAMVGPSVIAYCAHCDAPGLTDMPL